MATGDLTVANGVMKIVGGKLTKQYEEVPLLHNRLQKGRGTKISDRGVEIPTHLQGNYNHKFMTDGGEFPVGGSNTVKRAQVFFKNFAFAVRLSGAAIDAINSLDVAYIKDWLQFNLDESMSAGYKMGNIYAHGDGSGRLATLTSTTSSSVTSTVNNNDANRFLKSGLAIDFVVPGTGQVEASDTIDNAKASATTFTTVGTVTTATSGDYVVAGGSFNLAITGLAAIIDDTTNAPVVFQGLSRNTFPQYRAFRVNASSVGLDVSHLRRVLGAGIHINVGELNRDVLEIWSHPAQTAAYSSLGWNLRRFDQKSKSIDLGFSAYEYEGIAWVEDVDSPKDRLDFIDFSTMAKYVAKDFGWDDKTGSILRQVPGTNAYKDQYEAYMTARFNYGCTRPNKNGFIDTLAVPTGFTGNING
jgi:hypothetical protein